MTPKNLHAMTHVSLGRTFTAVPWWDVQVGDLLYTVDPMQQPALVIAMGMRRKGSTVLALSGGYIDTVFDAKYLTDEERSPHNPLIGWGIEHVYFNSGFAHVQWVDLDNRDPVSRKPYGWSVVREAHFTHYDVFGPRYA